VFAMVVIKLMTEGGLTPITETHVLTPDEFRQRGLTPITETPDYRVPAEAGKREQYGLKPPGPTNQPRALTPQEIQQYGLNPNGPYILVPMQRQSGVYVVSVLINEVIILNFVVDSGAADVTLPADVVSTLLRTGTIETKDFVGKQTYTLADGSTMPSTTFHIRSLRVGDTTVKNVTGGIAPVNGPLLLGQSFLRLFKSWSTDNNSDTLILEQLPVISDEEIKRRGLRVGR
jgi:hypothetical protein